MDVSGDVRSEGHEEREELVKGTTMRYRLRRGRQGGSERIWLNRRTGCEGLVKKHDNAMLCIVK
jgi:hypothetical protein